MLRAALVGVLAQRLDGDYGKGLTSWVKMPPIDVGRWTDVHLQYRRWLAVEDSHFDQARVKVNDKRAWLNFTASKGDSSSTHHIDREWRYRCLATRHRGVQPAKFVAVTLLTSGSPMPQHVRGDGGPRAPLVTPS